MIITILIILVVLYSLAVLYIYKKQERFVFDTPLIFDNKLDEFVMKSEIKVNNNLKIKPVSVSTPDENVLCGWVITKDFYKKSGNKEKSYFDVIQDNKKKIQSCGCSHSDCSDCEKDHNNSKDIKEINENKDSNNNDLLPDNEKPVIVFFHENFFNVLLCLDFATHCIDNLNCVFILFPYRGYGNSLGYPSEKGLITDGEAILDFVFNGNLDIDTHNVYLLGKSLGTAIAIHSSLKYSYLIKGIILENGFSSIEDVSYETFPWMFCLNKLLRKIDFNNKEKIKELSCPFLFLISKDDEVISYKQSLTLHDNAHISKYKDYKIFNFASHNGLYSFTSKKYFEKIRMFMQKCSDLTSVIDEVKNIGNSKENKMLYSNTVNNSTSVFDDEIGNYNDDNDILFEKE